MGIQRLLMLSSALGAIFGMSSAAYAQSTTSSGGSSGIGEVVVTAEKREQSLQDVPVAVSAYTAERRELLGINSIQDMTNFTPGLTYNSSTDRISLRGVGRLTNVLSGDAAVANYNDGIYETFAVAAGRSTMFLDRVEILRGPQGTLYGRNAIGGAINQISRRPTPEFSGEFRVNYGNYDHTTIEGTVSGPIINDRILGRIAAAWDNQNEGWIDNIVPGMPDEGGVVDTILIDTQLQIDISDRLDFWMKFAGGEWRNGAGGPGSQSAGWIPHAWPTFQEINDGTILNSGYGCAVGGTATAVVNASPTGCVNPSENTPWTIARAIPYEVTVPFYYQAAIHLTYHADNFDLRYVTGGVSYNYELDGPAGGGGSNVLLAPILQYTIPSPLGDVTIFPQESFHYEENNRFWSHELTLLSTYEGPLQFVAGAYYFEQRYTQPVYTRNAEQVQWNGPFPAVCVFVNPCPPGTDFRRYDNQPDAHAESWALYEQTDWQINDDWHATLGLRYSHDRKFGSEAARILCFGPAGCASPDAFGPFTPAIDITQLTPAITPAPVTCLPSPYVGPCTVRPDGFVTRRFDATWQAITGTAGIEWSPDDDTMIYGKYSRGYKSGGFNVGIFTVANSGWSDRELVDSYEVGFKRDFGATLRTNAALYYYEYTNLQIPIVVAHVGAPNTTDFYNVPDATSSGFELEATWQATEDWQFVFSYSYNKTEINEGTAIDIADPAALAAGARPLQTPAQCLIDGCRTDPFTAALPNGGFYRTQDLAGNSLPNAPENKFALNTNYTWRVMGGELVGSLSYIWRDEQFGTLFTRAHYRAPSWDQIDARLTWTNDDDTFRAILYGKNLADEIGYDAGAYAVRLAGRSNGGTVLVNEGIASGYSVTPPRTYGIELQYRF